MGRMKRNNVLVAMLFAVLMVAVTGCYPYYYDRDWDDYGRNRYDRYSYRDRDDYRRDRYGWYRYRYRDRDDYWRDRYGRYSYRGRYYTRGYDRDDD